MKKSIVSALIVAMLAPSISFAAPPVITVDLSESFMVPIKKGETAPFGGVLISPGAAAQISADYNSFNERVKLEVKSAAETEIAKKRFELQEQQSKFTFDKAVLEGKIATKEQQVKDFDLENKKLKQELKDAPERSTWFGIGFFTGLATTILTVFAVGSLAK